jgi:hypothetical protein
MPTTPFIHRNLPRLLLQARESVMGHTRPSLRAHGLSDQQWRVLRVLLQPLLALLVRALLALLVQVPLPRLPLLVLVPLPLRRLVDS